MDNNSISSDLIRGHIDTIILKTLLNEDKNGLEICQEIELRTEGKYEIRQATLYSALKRLENSKYIKPYWGEVDESDKSSGRRRYFHLTESGKDFVEKNQQNWAFSRDVIDLLVTGSVSPQKVFVQKIEEQAESPIITETQDEIPEEIPTTVDISVDEPAVIEEKERKILEFPTASEAEKPSSPVGSTSFNQSYTYEESESADFNYKSVLSRLIRPEIRGLHEDMQIVKVEEKPKEPDPVTIQETAEVDPLALLKESVKKEQPQTEEPTYDEFFIPKQSTRRMDFSDLFDKAEEDGLKIHISTPKKRKKAAEKKQDEIQYHKLNMVLSLGVYLLVLIELMALSITTRQSANTTIYFVLMIATLIFPVTMVIIYFASPQKNKTKPTPSYLKNILVSVCIVLFNIILIILAVSLLLNTDFSNPSQVIPRVVIPTLFVFDTLAYFIAQYCLINSKLFQAK